MTVYQVNVAMSEQTQNEIMMILMNWVESLHQTNLKYEARIQELEAEVKRNTEKNIVNSVPQINKVENHHQLNSNQAPITTMHQQHPHQQAIYQPLTNHPQTYTTQAPMQYMWGHYPHTTYDMQFQYQDQNYGIQPPPYPPQPQPQQQQQLQQPQPIPQAQKQQQPQ